MVRLRKGETLHLRSRTVMRRMRKKRERQRAKQMGGRQRARRSSTSCSVVNSKSSAARSLSAACSTSASTSSSRHAFNMHVSLRRAGLNFVQLYRKSARLRQQRVLCQRKLELSDMPLHILQKILGYLAPKDRVKLECVCQIWHHLLRHSWYTTTALNIPEFAQREFGIKQITDQHVCGMLRKCGRFLQSIHFFFLHGAVGDHVMSSIVQRCTRLRDLSLNTDVSSEAMYKLLKCISVQLPPLNSLTIAYHAEQGAGIYNGLRAVVRHMSQLGLFRLHSFVMPPNVSALFPPSPHMRVYCIVLLQLPNAAVDQGRFVSSQYLTDFFTYLVDVYPALEELDVSLDTDHQVDEQQMFELLQRIGFEKRVRRFNLRISYLYEDHTVWFGSTALRALASFHHLQDLCLWACELPDDFGQQLAMSGVGARLVSVRLAVVASLSHNLLCDLFAACPNLHNFSLIFRAREGYACPADINLNMFEWFYMYCPRIRSIELVDCDHIDLGRLIVDTHSFMHYTHNPWHNPPDVEDNVRNSDLLSISYMGAHRYRLRQLQQAAKCCVNVVREHEDCYKVTVPIYCQLPKPQQQHFIEQQQNY